MAEKEEEGSRAYHLVFELMPRQAPVSRVSVKKALGFCQDLPQNTNVLELGCGSGAQTMVLAEKLPQGFHLTAIDPRQALIDRLKLEVKDYEFEHSILPLCARIDAFPYLPGSCDLLWCAGSMPKIPLSRALPQWKSYLKPTGCMVFLQWLWNEPKETQDEALTSLMDRVNPRMTTQDEVLKQLRDAELDLVGAFMIPREDWWDGYYHPMKRIVTLLKTGIYLHHPVARAVMEQFDQEILARKTCEQSYDAAIFIARPKKIED